MSAAPYMVGRVVAHLSRLQGAATSDRLFAAQRFDDAELKEHTFSHCTFANVSFKGTTIRDTTFEDCVFANSYFRDARFLDCIFKGCRFIDSDLEKIELDSCDLRYYNRFEGCHLKCSAIEASSMPSEANLKQHLCFNLSREANRVGNFSDAGRYRQAAAEARELKLKTIAFPKEEKIRIKYAGRRPYAMFSLAGSKLQGWAWGYRGSFFVVFRNWVLITAIFFPLLYLSAYPGVLLDGHVARGVDFWLASLSNTLPGSGLSQIAFASTWAQSVAIIQAVARLIFAGLVGSLLFRAVFDKWR